MSNHPPTIESSERVAPALALWLVLIGVPTLLLNRALIPALPGSRSDIEQLLDRAVTIGSVSSQLLALGITLLLIRLITSSLGTASIPGIERLFVLPISSAVGFLVVAASAGTLDPELHLLLAGISLVGLLICSRTALRHPSTRAGGILLALIVVASVCLASARLVALRASMQAIPRQYAMSRGLATAGEIFDCLSLLWVMAWCILSTRNRGLVRVAIAIIITVSVTILARLGQLPDATFVKVVAARAFGALRREPNAYGSPLIEPASDLLAILLGLVLISLNDRKTAVARRAMALLMLGRCSLDVPALCGLATGGGLLLAWFAPNNALGSPTRPRERASTIKAGGTEDAR
jgi:hypothetical protein